MTMDFKIFQYDDNFRIGVNGKFYTGERLITQYFNNGALAAVSTIINAKGYEFIQIVQSPDNPIYNVGEKYVYEHIGA